MRCSEEKPPFSSLNILASPRVILYSSCRLSLSPKSSSAVKTEVVEEGCLAKKAYAVLYINGFCVYCVTVAVPPDEWFAYISVGN